MTAPSSVTQTLCCAWEHAFQHAAYAASAPREASPFCHYVSLPPHPFFFFLQCFLQAWKGRILQAAWGLAARSQLAQQPVAARALAVAGNRPAAVQELWLRTRMRHPACQSPLEHGQLCSSIAVTCQLTRTRHHQHQQAAA
jgi:hypothetical protein